MDELFARRGLSYVHVPYKGTAEQMVAVSSGQVMAGVNSNGFAPFVDSGRLRLLVTFGELRTRRWPRVPTLKELGYGIVAASPYGLAGPRGLPAPIVHVLHDAFRAAAFDPAHVAELARYDQELSYLGAEDYGREMRATYAAERLTVERLGSPGIRRSACAACASPHRAAASVGGRQQRGHRQVARLVRDVQCGEATVITQLGARPRASKVFTASAWPWPAAHINAVNDARRVR